MSSTALLGVVGLGTLRIRTARGGSGPITLLGRSGELRECTLYGSVSVRGRRVGWHGVCETVGRFRPRMPILGACEAVGPEIQVEVLRPLLFEMCLLFSPDAALARHGGRRSRSRRGRLHGLYARTAKHTPSTLKHMVGSVMCVYVDKPTAFRKKYGSR